MLFKTVPRMLGNIGLAYGGQFIVGWRYMLD